MVPLDPPTPAARVPAGRAFAAVFLLSAARRLTQLVYVQGTLRSMANGRQVEEDPGGYRIRVFAPPGIGGEAGRAGDAGEDYPHQNCALKPSQKGIP
jgi:hypothetical protein